MWFDPVLQEPEVSTLTTELDITSTRVEDKNLFFSFFFSIIIIIIIVIIIIIIIIIIF